MPDARLFSSRLLPRIRAPHRKESPAHHEAGRALPEFYPLALSSQQPVSDIQLLFVCSMRAKAFSPPRFEPLFSQPAPTRLWHWFPHLASPPNLSSPPPFQFLFPEFHPLKFSPLL